MTLRERLEAAKAERRRAAGLPVDDHPSGATPREPTSGPGAGGGLPTVDLTGTAPVLDLRTGREVGEGIQPARSLTESLAVSDSPSCPTCGDEGQLDMQDVAGGVDHYSCRTCDTLFQVLR